MDPKEFERIAGVPDPVQTQQPQQPESQGLELDPEHAKQALNVLVDGFAGGATPEIDPAAAQQFGHLLGSIQAGADAAQSSAPPATVQDFIGKAAGAAGVSNTDDPNAQPMTEDQRNQAGALYGPAAGAGGLKSVFETKDFLFGDTPREQQSAFRQTVEDEDDRIRKASPIVGGLSSGIGQFTVAMIGLGKLGMVAKALPYVGEAVSAVESIKGGSIALESGKAALAGAIAFDPHEARLSNLIQDTPLANPFNAWLAAKPGDTAAMGRIKNAMESLGMDAAIISTFSGGLKIWKYLKAGDTTAASRAVTELQAEQAAHVAEEQAPHASDVPPSGQDMEPPHTDAPPVSPEPIQDPLAPPKADGEAASPVDPKATPEATPLEQGSPADLGTAAANADDIKVEQVANPDSAGGISPVDAAKAQPFKPSVEFSAEDVAGSKPAVSGTGPTTKPGLMDELSFSLEEAEKDWDTLGKAGSWANAFIAGRNLTPDLGVFYSRFKSDTDVLHMIDLGVQRKAEELEAQGFRVRLGDSDLQAQVSGYAKLADTDPASLMGMLQQAGEESKTLTAKMIVLGSLTAKAFQDARNMATLLRLGDWTRYGGREGMEQEIAKRWSMATTLLKLTSDIRSQGGRTLRANRGKPFDPSLFEGLSKDRFYALLEQSDGSPENLKYLAAPSLFAKIMDTANYIRINSLISGYTTQAINVLSNGYMVGARPLERILGAIPGAALGDDAAKSLIKENLRQYAYTGTALWDGFKSATKAFMENESTIRPHTSEAYMGARWNVPGSQALNGQYFKRWDSVPNLIYNGLSVPLTVAGTPSRILGGVDELMKQTVYRSKLMARAHVEGVEQALSAGLRGNAADAFVKRYVQEQLDHGFDAEGRGLDRDALNEASIATFQQDLLPGTIGKGVQTLLASDKTKLTRLILPFVKTPTNVLRYAWKMTPGLNVLQGEYRAMLNGAMGHEAKAQAVGQMTLGALFMGSAAFIGQDRITGGGPSDPRVKAQLLSTGWRPYSIVNRNEDGSTTYVPFDRMDPVALPFGIIADIQDAVHIVGEDYESSPELMQAVGALGISLAKQFSSRTYLLSLNQALDALSNPDRFGTQFTGSMAQSFIPFSAATRQLSTDPYLRDARTITDKMVQAIPGLSKTLPPKYNWLGQPMVNRQGLWTDDNGTTVDQEVQRLSLLPEGSVISAPSPVMGSGSKVDLRDITLTTGENAYVAYQRLAGKPGPNAKTLREQVATRIRTDAYQRAPDGEVGQRGTKLWLLSQIVSKYRDVAAKRVRTDKNVRDALMAAQRKTVDQFGHLKQPVTAEQKSSIRAIIDGFGAGAQQ